MEVKGYLSKGVSIVFYMEGCILYGGRKGVNLEVKGYLSKGVSIVFYMEVGR
ncbi:hypothetical protein CWI38_2679p0020, partial [Hamiltosporidium tvaerminnensis]